MLYSTVNGTQLNLTHDVNEKNVFTLVYRPETWLPSNEVIQGERLYIPTISNGCMYSSIQGGITGLLEPIWETGKGKVTLSGSVKFQTIPYSLILNTGEMILADVANSVPAYEIILPVGVTIDNSSLILGGTAIRFRIVTTPSSGTFTITIRTSVLKTSGIYVLLDSSLNFTILPN